MGTIETYHTHRFHGMTNAPDKMLSIKELKQKMKLIILIHYDETAQGGDSCNIIDTNLSITDIAGNKYRYREDLIYIPNDTLTCYHDLYKDSPARYIPFVKGNEDIETTDFMGDKCLASAPKGDSLKIKRIKGYNIVLGDHFVVQGEEFCPCKKDEKIYHVSEIPKDCQGCEYAGNP